FWQLPAAAPRALAAPHGDAVTALALSADGSQIVSASADKTVRLSNFANGAQVRQLPGPTAALTTVSLSANNGTVAGGCADSKLMLWNAADGQILSQPSAHSGAVTAVAFHPQGSQLLSAGADGLLKLWALPAVPPRVLTHPDAVLVAV